MNIIKSCVYYLAPRDPFHHAHHAWVDELIKAEIRCKDCWNLKWPKGRPRQIFLDGVNKLTAVQSAWLLGVSIVDAELWESVARHLNCTEKYEVYLPAKRISTKLREAQVFDQSQFQLRSDLVGIEQNASKNAIPLGCIGDSDAQTRSVCASCGSVNYAVPDREMYVLSSDWGKRVCCFSNGYLLMVGELAEALQVSRFKGSKLCRVAIVDEAPPLKSSRTAG